MSHRAGRAKKLSPAEQRDLCLDEAVRGMQSAEALAKIGEFGRARSLDLLAYEAAIQGLAYHMVARGWATFDRTKRRQLLYISERALRNHPLKQFLIAAWDPVMRNLSRDVAEHAKKGQNPGVGPELAVTELTAESGDPPLPLEHFNRMKNDGLYPSTNPTGTTGSSAVTKESFETLHRRINRRVRLTRGLSNSEIPEEVEEEFREYGRKMAREGRAFDEEFLFKLRKAKGRGFELEKALEEAAEVRFHDPSGVWRT